MATRQDIREAFYADLETAASGLVPAEDIGQEYPNEDEGLPAIVHTDNYRTVPMNTKTGIVDKTVDGNGDVTAIVFAQMMEARFSLLMVSDDEQEKESIYEAVRTYFEEYEFPVKDAASLHGDVNTVRVNDSNSEDSEDRDPPARGDRLQVNVEFKRTYTKSVDHIDDVQANVDADNDDITDITYTTN